MNGRCETCYVEKVCVYPYKPTECCDFRKFEKSPLAESCPTCTGYGCNSCNSTGFILKEPS